MKAATIIYYLLNGSYIYCRNNRIEVCRRLNALSKQPLTLVVQ
jgi:hypothetical protein